MVFKRNFGQAILAGALLLASPTVLSAAPEPLVVTRMADPDPNFVSSSDASSGKVAAGEPIGEDAKIDAAMQSFGRAIGEAAIVEQQQILALCRSGAPANASAQQRFAYEANCRYSRR